MEVSRTCQDFIMHVCGNRWRDAVIFANGMNMYEMLRAFKALDAADIFNFRGALVASAGAVFADRMEYALSVVETGRLPATAPGDLQATGQVSEAARFVARPRSILSEPVPKSTLSGFNAGVVSVNNAFMIRTLGSPRSTFSQTCQPVDSPALRRRIATRNVGPFRATGLDSALSSLTTIMSTIAADLRIVHRVLGTEGMLCARNVRGSTTNISNHSWGTAIDITVGGVLDVRGDNSVQFGLQLIAPKFNAAGWFWGMEFPTEDGMHFEGGQAIVATWATP